MMADELHTSGSLTDKELQTSSTTSALGLMDGHGRQSGRDMISELRNLFNASGIHELRDWMAAVENSMMNLEMVVAAQSSKMGEMVSALEVLKQPNGHLPKPVTPSEPPQPQRPSEDPISLPQTLPTPRQVSPQNISAPKSSHSSRPNVSAESDPPCPRRKSWGSLSKHSKKSESKSTPGLEMILRAKPPMTMQDLEEFRASQLLRSMNRKESMYKSLRRGHSSHDVPSRSASHKSVRPQQAVSVRPQQAVSVSVEHVEPKPPLERLPSGKKKAFTMNSRLGGEDKAAVLEKCQRVSLEELRTNYDAVISEFNTTKTSRTNLDAEVSALPRFGRCLLCMAGHLRFNSGLASKCFAVFSYGISPVAVCSVLLYGGVVDNMDTGLLLTLICFQLGISVASFSFQHKGVALLLGPEENRLDDYALEADFMSDWQKLSRRRLMETGCMYFVMMCIRFGSYVWVTGRVEFNNTVWDNFYGIAFWFMLFRYLLLCYSILHCCCGLELALDSFGVRFFKEMDIEEALGEWNTLQATLRQVSTKIGDALLAIGSCCLASMVLLGEQVITNPQNFVETPGRMTSWLSRYYPLMIIFVYTMMRAAAVTEKANRVAPLVNSWKFHDSHHNDDSEGLWMDHERQYAVQYISQSRAGFFIRGSQLTVPTVQKLLYYVGAVSFALFSRLSAV